MEKNRKSPVVLPNEARIPENRNSGKTGMLMKYFLFAAFLAMMAFAAGAQNAKAPLYNNVDANGVILDGYDAVAFFTDNKPVKGDHQFSSTYEGATYYFASAAHRELFNADPEKYKPQFGAWCAYAVSLGRVAPIDVNTFSVVNGRLLLQHNQRAVNGWNKDVEGNLKLADNYWPKVADGKGKQIVTDDEKKFLNNLDPNGIILQGYDVVSYFSDNKPVHGDPRFEARYNGGTYWFSSQAHADLFKDHPEKYAPQYGAFCGYAMSLNKLRPVDPEIFQILEGRLILQHTQDAYTQFNKDLAGNIVKADGNWPGQVKKHAGKKVAFDKPAKPASTDNSTTQN